MHLLFIRFRSHCAHALAGGLALWLCLGALVPFPAAAAFPTLPVQTPQEADGPAGDPQDLIVTSLGDTIVDSRSRVVRAQPVTGDMTIDGRLDESDWQRAEPAVGFRQVEPDEDQPALEPTEVRVLYGSEDLYVGARMFDRDPPSIQRQLTRRDEGGRAYDYFQLSLDSNDDDRTGYTFRITAAGVQIDRYNFDDTSSDQAWDGIWEAGVTIDGEGWVAELRIPLSQLRLDPSPDPQSWGIQFGRRKISTNERTDWAYVPRGVSGDVSRWGRLEGLVLPDRSRHLEIVPYVSAGLERAPSTPGDPFFDGQAGQTNAGADLRYGLGSTFMLDAAVNPDFGQVEVDPRVINLSAFETFFPERRPFFTRDDRLFDFGLSGGSNNLFYSRRIGRSPQGPDPSDAEFVDRAEETRILGAAKLTGRTESGLTIGVLGALTGEESGRAVVEEETEIRSFVIEPRTSSAALRLLQELREGETTVGFLATGLHRDLPSGGRLDFLTREAFSGGFDFEHTWSDRAWALWGFLAGSHVRGSEEAITRVQRTANHYHQRPDQDYLRLDPEATSLSGLEWRLQLESRGGRNWGGAIWAAQRTPGFEVNDLGFSTASERLDGGARLSYSQPTPGDVLRSWRVSASTFHNWRHSLTDDFFSASAWGDSHKAGRISANANLTFLSYWGLGFGAGYQPRLRSDGLTRGGPLMISPGVRSISVSGSSDERDRITYSASADFEWDDEGGWGREFSAGLELRPANGVLLNLEPTYQRSFDRNQYVARIEDALYEATFGDRYLFGELERREFSLDIRINVIASPTLSFQLFAQPLVGSGTHRSFRQLEVPGSYAFLEFDEGEAVEAGGETRCTDGAYCRSGGRIHLDYTGDAVADTDFGERDFHLRSLRGSAVLRWEYRPGSRVYLVWQQSRQGRELYRDFDLGNDLGSLWDTPAEHQFILKIDYWLSP